MVLVIFKPISNYISKKKKAVQATWSDNDDLSIDDDNIVSGLVIYDKKLELEDSDDERSKSCDVSLPCY